MSELDNSPSVDKDDQVESENLPLEKSDAQQRIVLGVEYNGSAFSGYQMQAHGTRTVQDELEKALSKVANESIRVTCAGRTDTGVHATGQVVHFDTTVQRKLKAWMLGGNTNLPGDVSIHWVRKVNDSFSARFSAVSQLSIHIIQSSHASCSIPA